MFWLRRLVLLGLLGCLVQAQELRYPLEPIPGLVILEAQFGVFENVEGRVTRFTATDRLPYRMGLNFGWLLRVRTTRPTLRLEDGLYLPGEAVTWGGEESGNVIVERDRRAGYRNRDWLVGRDGQVMAGLWSLTQGDPQGWYGSELSLDGRPIARQRFWVGAAAPTRAPVSKEESADGG